MGTELVEVASLVSLCCLNLVLEESGRSRELRLLVVLAFNCFTRYGIDAAFGHIGNVNGVKDGVNG